MLSSLLVKGTATVSKGLVAMNRRSRKDGTSWSYSRDAGTEDEKGFRGGCTGCRRVGGLESVMGY